MSKADKLLTALIVIVVALRGFQSLQAYQTKTALLNDVAVRQRLLKEHYAQMLYVAEKHGIWISKGGEK